MSRNLTEQVSSSFVIVAQPRSGSTLLAMALDSHPDIVCHDEIFSQNSVHGYRPDKSDLDRSQDESSATLLEERTRDPERFLFDRVFLTGAGKRTGFKVVYSDIFARTPSSEFLRDFLIRSRIRVIHLRRLNLLRCFVSVERMRRLGITHSRDTLAVDTRLDLELAEFLGFAVMQDGNSDLVNRMMNVTAQPRYEHLIQGYNATLDALGVARRPFVQHLSRLSSQSLSGLVKDHEKFSAYDFPRADGFVTYSE